MEYEQIPFECKVYQEYGHFAKKFLKKPINPNTKETPGDGWNEFNRRKGPRTAPPQAHLTSSKKTIKNRFQALASEDNEEEEIGVAEETQNPNEGMEPK